MRVRTTLEEIRAAYEPAIGSLPYNKPRDPFEREILKSLGDPNVSKETQGLTRVAGERFTPQRMSPQETSPTPEDPAPDESTTVRLGTADWDALQEALEAPPRPMPKMEALLQGPGYFDGQAPSLEDLKEGIRRAVADRHAPDAPSLNAVQAACAEVLGGGGVVEEFLAERRQEAEGESGEA